MTVASANPNVINVAYMGLHAKEVAALEAKVAEIEAAKKLDPWERLPRKNLFQFPELYKVKYRCKQSAKKVAKDQVKARRKKFCDDRIKEIKDRALVQNAARTFCGISFQNVSEGGVPVDIDMAYLKDPKKRAALKLPVYEGGASLPEKGVIRLDDMAAKKMAGLLEQGALVKMDAAAAETLAADKLKTLRKKADALKIKNFTKMGALELEAAIAQAEAAQ